MSDLIPIKLAEMAMANLEAEVADLKSTADRLKAEVEHLTSENKLVREESDRHYQLWVDSQAEVERLTAEVSYDKRVQLHVDKLAAEFTQYEVENLKAELERLRKAGDAMLYNMTYYKSFVPDNGNIHHMIDASILGWNPKYGHTTEYGKAKEGKQS